MFERRCVSMHQRICIVMCGAHVTPGGRKIFQDIMAVFTLKQPSPNLSTQYSVGDRFIPEGAAVLHLKASFW